jgi:hypothetical protein
LRCPLRLGLASPRNRVLLPNLVRVLFHLDLDPQLAYWTDDHIDTVVVTGEDAFVVIRSRMLCAMDLFAPVTFERQKVLLLAFTE